MAGSQAVLASQQFESSEGNETESELLSSWSSPDVEESDTDIGAVGGYSSPTKSCILVTQYQPKVHNRDSNKELTLTEKYIHRSSNDII